MVDDEVAYFISCKEPKSEWKYPKIAYSQTGIKKNGGEGECNAETILFFVVQSWLYESPDFKYDIRKTNYEGEYERCSHVNEKLGGQLDVDDIDSEIFVAE